ncbi:cytochrome b/b6 domain-containing protein [Brachymonas denitrificans]|uniref:cytochrome b/b6 domain-containing protein n=1 Tax=Brachymonas denitrificans TaxID=28220 RepID=UPI0032E7FE39
MLQLFWHGRLQGCRASIHYLIAPHCYMSVEPVSTVPVRVWDLPTRLFHWALALLVVVLVVSGTVGGLWMEWHLRAGMGVLALLLFRLVWGVIGGHWSRFANFLYSPSRMLRYLRGDGQALDEVGHSPAGALSVWAMLLVLGVQGVIGLFAYDDIAFSGPLAHLVSNDTVSTLTGLHKLAKPLIISLVLLHVGAIVFYRVARKRNLVGPMLLGDKQLPPGTPASRDSAGTRLLALLLFAACAGFMVWVSSLAGEVSASYM